MAFSWVVNFENLIFYGVNVESVSGRYLKNGIPD